LGFSSGEARARSEAALQADPLGEAAPQGPLGAALVLDVGHWIVLKALTTIESGRWR